MSLASLLARRLCHDLAGPAGAIGTAVDMLTESTDPELVALAADSAAALSSALELYRYVLTPPPEPVGGGRARTLVAAWLRVRGELTLDWPDDDMAWPVGCAALTAGLAMVAADCAPAGTVLKVEAGSVVAPGATLAAEIAAGLTGRPVTTTRAALAGVLANQARNAGMDVAVDNDGSALRLTASYQSSRQ